MIRSHRVVQVVAWRLMCMHTCVRVLAYKKDRQTCVCIRCRKRRRDSLIYLFIFIFPPESLSVYLSVEHINTLSAMHVCREPSTHPPKHPPTHPAEPFVCTYHTSCHPPTLLIRLIVQQARRLRQTLFYHRLIIVASEGLEHLTPRQQLDREVLVPPCPHC